MSAWPSVAVWYLSANFALGLAWLAFVALRRVTERMRRGGGAHGTWLRLARFALIAALAAPPLAWLAPRRAATTVVDEFARNTAREGAQLFDRARLGPAADLPRPVVPHRDATLPFGLIAAGALAALAALRLVRAARELRDLRRLARHAAVLHAVGRTRVVASDDIRVACAFRDPWRAVIALPSALVADPAMLRLALCHEAQHHRQGDATWLVALAALSALFPLNPFFSAWRRTLAELAEFACDEALVATGRATPRAYGLGLVRAAELAVFAPASRFAAAMATTSHDGRADRSLLHRRIAMLAFHSTTARRPARRLALTAGLALALSALGGPLVAYAARTNPSVTRSEVAKIVAESNRALGDDGIALQVNDAVVARINKIVADPDRRAGFREALARMDELKPMIGQALERYDAPNELLAVPMIESYYRNLEQKSEHTDTGTAVGAGLWMFIRETARNYGLNVTSRVDQRLDPRLETDAAMRYLKALKLRFRDWHLALAAYNQGETRVQSAISEAGTRNAWRMVNSGHLNDYLVDFTAAAVLIRHPQLIE